MTPAPNFPRATNDVRRRCERVAVALLAIARQTDPTLADPRAVFVDIVVATHELEAAMRAMRRTWWP